MAMVNKSWKHPRSKTWGLWPNVGPTTRWLTFNRKLLPHQRNKSLDNSKLKYLVHAITTKKRIHQDWSETWQGGWSEAKFTSHRYHLPRSFIIFSVWSTFKCYCWILQKTSQNPKRKNAFWFDDTDEQIDEPLNKLRTQQKSFINKKMRQIDELTKKSRRMENGYLGEKVQRDGATFSKMKHSCFLSISKDHIWPNSVKEISSTLQE